MKTMRIPAFFLAASVVITSTSMAQDTVLGMHGGAGGSAFDYRAPAGQRIHTISVYSGTYVDGLQLWYRDETNAIRSNDPRVGNTTGTRTNFAIPEDDYLTGVDVWSYNGFVNQVTFQTRYGNGATFGSRFTGDTRQNFRTGTEEIIGLVGRSGALMIALGAVSRPVMASYSGRGNPGPCDTSQGNSVLIRLRAGDPSLALGQRSVLEAGGVPAGLQAILNAGVSTSSWNGLPLPFRLVDTCDVLVAPEISIGVISPPSRVPSLAIDIPNDAVLVGALVSFQWLAIDPGANALGIVTSGALTFLIGT
ncbi:MAG: hypothetical protein H6834_10170 [Planctomycetes bacterium]|nr:hypothetical protein [Planctomycetota bacterium]